MLSDRSSLVDIFWKYVDFGPSGICYVYRPATLSGYISICNFAEILKIGNVHHWLNLNQVICVGMILFKSIFPFSLAVRYITKKRSCDVNNMVRYPSFPADLSQTQLLRENPFSLSSQANTIPVWGGCPTSARKFLNSRHDSKILSPSMKSFDFVFKTPCNKHVINGASGISPMSAACVGPVKNFV